MKIFPAIALLILAALASSTCGNSGGPAQESGAWYSGGTLHDSTMIIWSRSTDAVRLATSGDFAGSLMRADGILVPSIDQIRPIAETLERCVSAANRDGIADDQDATDVASACWMLFR